ncbi:MAG: endonuclease III [Rickettsiales bacterium]|jgi:endonuclease-3|nr:endonuclease III [Rickettsiales bacterium]
MTKRYINKIFKILEEKYRGTDLTELNYFNPYTLLVATMLSAQTTDKMVNKVTKELFRKAKTPNDMLELGEGKLKEYIKSINYFNTKAKNIIKMSNQLIDNFGSVVPNTMEDLTKLAGVGRKTASIILNIVYGKKAIAVDTHVFRLSNRIGLVKTKNVKETELKLLDIVPNNYVSCVNNYLVLLGRYVCKSKKPDCDHCPLETVCKKIY